jgi:hypothetical protein
VDLETGQNAPVYEDQSILGYNPAWSPDSNKLASYDGLADSINLLDWREKQQYIFPSNTGGPVTWSPDSNLIFLHHVEQTEDGLRTQVRLADLALNDSITLIGANDSRDYSYYSLAWSPLENRAVLGFRAGRGQTRADSVGLQPWPARRHHHHQRPRIHLQLAAMGPVGQARCLPAVQTARRVQTRDRFVEGASSNPSFSPKG